ncbi:MAG TPA: META domain-containing protein [Usitatibacter sp.]
MNRGTILAAAALLAACSTPEQREPPPKPFVGTHWMVVLELKIPGEQPNMRFGDGRVEGFGGCSKFHAPILQDSVGAGALVIRRLEVERRLCDSSVQAAEDHVLEILQSIQSYKILGDAMSMSGSAGGLKLIALPPGGHTP